MPIGRMAVVRCPDGVLGGASAAVRPRIAAGREGSVRDPDELARAPWRGRFPRGRRPGTRRVRRPRRGPRGAPRPRRTARRGAATSRPRANGAGRPPRPGRARGRRRPRASRARSAADRARLGRRRAPPDRRPDGPRSASGVCRPLAGTEFVGVAGLEREAGAAIVGNDPRGRLQVADAESAEQALDQRDAPAVGVGSDECDRVALEPRLADRNEGCPSIEPRTTSHRAAT